MAQRCLLSTLGRMTAHGSASLLLVLLLNAAALGQGSTPQRGFQPGGSYALSDIETINTTNGNLSLHFALGKLAPGRGGFSGQLNLHYDSKLYDSKTEWYQDWDHLVFGQPHVVVRNMLVTSEQGGWHYGTGYELQLIDRMSQYPPEIAPQYPAQETIYHYKVKVAFPDGSVHEFMPRVGSLIEQGYSDIRPDGFQSRYIGATFRMFLISRTVSTTTLLMAPISDSRLSTTPIPTGGIIPGRCISLMALRSPISAAE